MRITNEFSKKKIDKSKIMLNKIINIKKKLRQKTASIIPLTDTEKFLYIDSFENDDKSEKIPENKYINITDIFLLNTISRKDCKSLYAGILNLYNDNYYKGHFGGEIRTDDLKKSIMKYMNKNKHGWSHLCFISPSNNELYNLCDFIEISIYDISDDVIGIAFDLKVTNNFNEAITNILNKKVENREIYERYKYKRKYILGKCNISPMDIINSEFEDFILEFKCRFNKLFKKYLPLQLDFKKEPPISINVYQTNFNVKDRNEAFYCDLNILNDYFAHEVKNVSICIDGQNKSDEIKKTKMWYNISTEYDKVDRSNNFLYYLEDKKHTIKHMGNEFTNVFIASLTLYLLEEMQKDINIEKVKLYNCKRRKINKNFKQYEALDLKFHKYSSIFKNFDINYSSYKDDYIIKIFDYINKKYIDYNNLTNEIRQQYEIRLNFNSIKSSRFLSKLSIFLAFIALITSIYFEYRNKNNDKISKIEENISNNNNIVNEINNKIEQIKEILDNT